MGALSAAPALQEVSLISPGETLDSPCGPHAPDLFAVGSCIVGEGTVPILARVVCQVQALEYVDFVELLPDNLEMLRRMQSSQAGQGKAPSRRRPRQIMGIPTWVQCFAVYAGVLLQRHPGRALDLRGYLWLVVHEAQCHSGMGWLIYDARFRQLAAANHSLSWSQLHPSLYVLTILAMDQALLPLPTQTGSRPSCLIVCFGARAISAAAASHSSCSRLQANQRSG